MFRLFFLQPLLPSPSQAVPSIVQSSSNSPSSSVFDGSIDHVWISFPEPPNQIHSNSNSFKRPRTSLTAKSMATPKKLFSYTRYDWNFLSTLSPTVLGWFCVINRIQKPIEDILDQREKQIDTILAYFLIETPTKSSLPVSKYQELFTNKSKYFLSQPVCQLVNELRKSSNRKTEIDLDLRADLIPEIQILKQGIRESCRGWAQTIKQSSQNQTINNGNGNPTTNVVSPITQILTNNDHELPPAVVRAPTMVDRVQRFIGHEFVIAHPRQPSIYSNRNIDNAEFSQLNNPSAVRRRPNGQNQRKDTTLEIIPDLNESNNGERRRASTFLGKSKRKTNFRLFYFDFSKSFSSLAAREKKQNGRTLNIEFCSLKTVRNRIVSLNLFENRRSLCLFVCFSA